MEDLMMIVATKDISPSTAIMIIQEMIKAEARNKNLETEGSE